MVREVGAREPGRQRRVGGAGTAVLAGAALAAAGLGVLGVLAASPPEPPTAGAAAPPASSAQSLLTKALHDAIGGGWVHEVGHGTAPGHTFSAVNDVGTFEGRQHIRQDGSRAEVVQIGQKAYIRGNAKAVAHFFAITSDDPAQLADTWLSTVPSDGKGYNTVIDAVTLKSDFSHQTIEGPLSEGHAVTVQGRRCIPIVGHVSSPQIGTAKATLYVTDTKHPLPVEYKASNAKATSDTIWTHWGRRVSLRPPLDAVPLSSLGT